MQFLLRTNVLIVAFFALVAGCSRDTAEEPSAAPAPAASPTEESTGPAANSQPVQSELAGTAWQLVKIMSMDDTEVVPEDGSNYTLAFGADGRASILADCNRGTGSYTSESPGQLTFGPVATTRMACPEGSLEDTFLAQFEWVRSYVFEGGNLFLATMADGSIIEFEPAPADGE